MLGRHAEILIRRKKRKAKSVNDIRTGNARDAAEHKKSDGADLEARIKSRKAKNLKMAEVKTALAGAGYIARPDISGAIDRALRLKGSARVINEAMAHPAWRYVAMAIIRGHAEEGASDPSTRFKPSKTVATGQEKGQVTSSEANGPALTAAPTAAKTPPPSWSIGPVCRRFTCRDAVL